MNGQRLRPLGLGDIFDEGFDLYKRNFVFFLLVTALTVVPLDIALTFVRPGLFSFVFDLFGVSEPADAFWVWLLAGVTNLAVFLPVFLLCVAPLAAASAGRYMGHSLTLWQVYQPWLRRLPGLLLTLLLLGLVLALSLFVCLVPWLVAGPLLFFTLHAFVVEGKRPGKALSRSGALVSGYGGRVFNCLFLLWLIGWVLKLGISLPLGYLVNTLLNAAPGAQAVYGGGSSVGQSSEQQIVGLISSGLAHLLVIPFVMSVATVLFYDLQIRKEAFDVELLAEKLHYPPLMALGPYLPPVAVPGPANIGPRPPARPAQMQSKGPQP